jgi:hypothetical protein
MSIRAGLARSRAGATDRCRGPRPVAGRAGDSGAGRRRSAAHRSFGPDPDGERPDAGPDRAASDCAASNRSASRTRGGLCPFARSDRRRALQPGSFVRAGSGRCRGVRQGARGRMSERGIPRRRGPTRRPVRLFRVGTTGRDRVRARPGSGRRRQKHAGRRGRLNRRIAPNVARDPGFQKLACPNAARSAA